MDMNLSKFWEIVKGREAWNVTAHDLVTEQQQNMLIDWLINPIIFLIEVWLIYNIVLVSGVQHSDLSAFFFADYILL